MVLRKILIYFSLILLLSTITRATQPIFINDGKSPMVSEFMASNKGLVKDNFGEYPDWLEIFNPTDTPINLYGWYLSDDKSKLYKWRLPEIILQPNNYLVVYLSGRNDISNQNYLHANFKLEAPDESLTLTKPDGSTKAWYFEKKYPSQYPNISYGLLNGKYEYLQTPTPGKANTSAIFLPAPTFSVAHGVFDQPFSLSLTASHSNAEIIYTTNGSTPTKSNGTKYTSPIQITTTKVIRARAYLEGSEPGEMASYTYIFPKDVVKQPIQPSGYPTQWGPYTAISGNAIGDYEMDPEVVSKAAYTNTFDEAFRDIPTVCITSDISNLFSNSTDPEKGGIYYYTGAPISNTTYALGKEWERPASIEYFIPGTQEGFTINCGLKLNGGHSRRPEKCPKHSFRLLFKDEYGPTRLEYDIFKEEDAVKSFNRLILRGGFGNTWVHVDPSQRSRGQYIQDSWAKDTHRKMGNRAAHNQFVHLYLNGLYWGVYNLCERMDEDFMASYFKGKDTDFDVIKDYTEVVSGDLEAWNQMGNMLQTDLTKPANYFKLLGKNADGTPNIALPIMVDSKNLIDYMLINFYGGNNDWDHHNWVAARNKTNPEGFKFFPWDTEIIFGGINDDVTAENNNNCPSGVFQNMLKSAEFKMELADRIYLHFFNNGELTPNKAAANYLERANEVRKSIVCESARWGDYRRDVHVWTSKVHRLYTLNDDWIPELNNLTTGYFPKRTEIVINQLKNAGYYPSLNPPVLDAQTKEMKRGQKIAIKASAGTIYYTLDGSDPRKIGGTVSSSAKAYSASDSVTLQFSTTVYARTFQNGTWSALASSTYLLIDDNGIYNLTTENTLNDFRVFPNPANEHTNMHFTINNKAKVTIVVYHISGAKVASFQENYFNGGKYSWTLETNKMKPGLYICNFESDEFSKSAKLIISK